MSASIRAGVADSALQQGGVDSIIFDSNGLKSGLGSAFAGAIYGLTLSNNVTDANNDIDIAVGGARDTGDTETMNLVSILVKRLDVTWAVGTNAGGLFSGSKVADTWYHLFLIRKDSDGSIDAGFDTSVTAANIPTGYTAYRRIGSVLTNGSSNIIEFKQKGDVFTWDVQSFDVSTTTPGTSANTATMSTPVGIVTFANIIAFVDHSAQALVLVTSLEQTDSTPSTSLNSMRVDTQGANNTISTSIKTNLLSQIRYRVNVSPVTNFMIWAIGWTDSRGQN